MEYWMSHAMIAAFVCYALVVVLAFAFSATYLMRSEFMPYHQEAIGKPWGELDAAVQTIILALMRGGGGSGFTLGLAMGLILLFPFREGRSWAIYALPALGLAVGAATLSVMFFVKRRTPAHPPIAVPMVVIALSVVGLVLSQL